MKTQVTTIEVSVKELASILDLAVKEGKTEDAVLKLTFWKTENPFKKQTIEM